MKLEDLKRLQEILKRTEKSPRVQAEPDEAEPADPPSLHGNGDNDDIGPRCSPRLNQNEATPSPRVQSEARSLRVPTGTRDNDADGAARTHTIAQEAMLHIINLHQSPFLARNAASRRFPKEVLAAVLNKETGELMEYRHLIANPKYRPTWMPSYGKEIGRLAQGIPGVVDGTDTIKLIFKNQVPEERWRNVTYGRICANYRPEKDDP